MRLFFIRFTTAVLLSGSGALWALDWRGNLSSELSYAPEAAAIGDGWVLNTSVAAEVELSHDSCCLPPGTHGNSMQALAQCSGESLNPAIR